ncbi:alpha/beta fold hydrolase [Gordonia sp. CPCC 205515]|uniref:alpha/beta hydrolase family protein n=1 Tax=Gordonia sp. CPCC 205515 TaxID=3140791 RepID=UPI003AF40755
MSILSARQCYSSRREVLIVVSVVVVLVVLASGCAGFRFDSNQASRIVSRPAPTASPAHVAPVRLSYPSTGTPDPRQNMGDLYLPPAPAVPGGTLPLVVLVHGGGWQAAGGDLRGLAPVARALAARGIAVFNVEYRRVGSGGGWPTTLIDVRDATDFADTLYQRFPVLSRGRIVLVGHSAGGHLALWAAMHARPAPRAVVSIAGPLDLTYAALHGDRNVTKLLGGRPDQVPARYALADPSRLPAPTLPVVLIQGTRDRVVPTHLIEHYLEDITGPVRPVAISLKGATHTSPVIPGRTGFMTVIDTITRLAHSAPGFLEGGRVRVQIR